MCDIGPWREGVQPEHGCPPSINSNIDAQDADKV